MKKKIFFIFLILLFLLTIVSCKAANNKLVDEIITATESTTIEKETSLEIAEATTMVETTVDETSSQITVVQATTPIIDAPKDFIITRPIDEKYTLLYKTKSPAWWITNLESGVEIKAVFNGKISEIVKHNPYSDKDIIFTFITLTREDNKFFASYTFFGDVLIDEGDSVTEGDVLGITKSTEEYDVQDNFSFSVQDDNYNYISAESMNLK